MEAQQWVHDTIPDQSGRRVMITGANSGIGFEAARLLAGRGADVVLACRNVDRGRQAARTVQASAPGADVDLVHLDLSDLSAVAVAAERWREQRGRLDVLINNAGVMATPLERTSDGFELQFATNHLGHFALTGRLLDALLTAERPRVVTVASGAHRMGSMPFDDLNWTARRYHPWRAYGQSKLANLLFTFELQRRAAAADLPLIALAAHPGYAATQLQARGPRMRGSSIGAWVSELANRLFAQDAAHGALPIVAAAALPDARGADYRGPDGCFESRGLPTRVPASTDATDPTAAARLWERSVELTGVRYDALRPTPT